MVVRKKASQDYHHGNLATALLDAVEALAAKFGLEAVSLRACAKSVGVSPAAAFRHYADKRALLTAFASRGLETLADNMQAAREQARAADEHEYLAVGMAYVSFALDQPSKYQVIWRQELLDQADPDYQQATSRLAAHLASGFADSLPDDNPKEMSEHELLAWASVHGVASLMIDGPVGRGQDRPTKLDIARNMLIALSPALSAAGSQH